MPDATRIPVSKQIQCSVCGRITWKSRTSAPVVKCHPCRRATPAPRSVRKNPDGVAWDCAWCGKRCSRPPMKGQIPKYCGPPCQWSASDARRRRGRGEFIVSAKRRRRLYERDGWTCQICGDATGTSWTAGDPWSPTLDHIEPQASVLVPDHSDENLRTAHAFCNTYRGSAQRSDEEVRAAALRRR